MMRLFGLMLVLFGCQSCQEDDDLPADAAVDSDAHHPGAEDSGRDAGPGDAAADSAPPPVACEGVEVIRGPSTYCAVHDSHRALCPASAPVRTPYRGVAVCGVDAPDDLAGIAIEALQTGRLLALATTFQPTLPTDAGQAPGVAPGSAVQVAVMVQVSGGSWFTPDGAPASCTQTFDHLEAHSVDGNIWISAWNRVHCEQLQNGLETYETHALELRAPGIGLHLIRLRTPDQDVPGPVLVVGVGEVCEFIPQAECFSGYLFAECAEALPPSIWCTDPTRSSCRWFTGGCPAAEYPHPVVCLDDVYCPSSSLGWGSEIWDRNLGMSLEFQSNFAEEPPAAPSVDCTCAEPPCLAAHASMCNPARTTAYRVERALASVEPPGGLHVITLWPELEEPTPDWMLAIEADPGAHRARACLFQTSDAGHNGPPVCAHAGRLELDSVAAHGRLQATFEVPGNGPTEIEAAF